MTEGRIQSYRKKIYVIRQKLKAKKPKFLRYDSDKFYRLGRQEKWRRPYGRDNKTRLKVRGFPAIVSVGYRLPKKVRGFHPSGLRQVIVHNVNELVKVQNQKDNVIVTISSSVGFKKRLEILNKARELGLKVSNEGVVT
ncbi:50S ribosomal protein L32e [Saccharolobus solfataricus]|uniref:Large ribosomal subunit protein eL32 n=3 Tax=Saccharolobus solfataricus TaxID=2287 RepID=RL32_SACS2|nr:50S ribosomal protein L32e [Saccharolobus solfataricus]Q9UX90.1 RecName: Full=Large ribosomal subunit protein eL32; AltName: Full=50S ribosomal protein L32e [Saccharolobus solfataricus P2]AAK41002.1 LSU ribosomal protein L32E (rpl32E) [Saccharolobus solfataricus P2]AKA74030.1 50S ribosomal protein L32e [Saccharolobus solfataricus]AKA76727.1 50S ribosomal protein L32e [Saccharolobus solfataricus]AKA79421.1 50S ribosomal protein L32e [Saccharolobus solfataricus]AZF68508.1 50S ribosomal prote